MADWTRRPLCGFDLETSGVDTDNDRIVTAAAVHWGGGLPTAPFTWVSDLGGAEIPPEATAINGWTTEAARTAGRPAAAVVAEITEALAAAVAAGMPLVAMNASFDLTLLNRECERYGVRSLWARTDVTPLVLDPRVLDKQMDRRRSGSRRLEDLCSFYCVRTDGAHEALADAKAACEVVCKIGRRYPRLARTPLADLHEQQVRWAHEQNESLAAYFERTPGKEHLAVGMDRYDWPLTPRWPDPVAQ